MKREGLLERLLMRASYSRRFDGLWIGIFAGKKDHYLVERVEDALKLVKQYDLLRYNRVLRDVEQIWISIRIDGVAEFNSVSGVCHLDRRYIERAAPATIASTIVHEATHGYPCLRKIGYPEKLRYRIEQICFRQQLIFVRRLPDSEELCKRLERRLKIAPSFWSNSEFIKRRLDQERSAAKAAGLPDWLFNFALVIREVRARLLEKRR